MYPRQEIRAMRLTLMVFVLLTLPMRLWPQFASGTINGVVKDSTGAVIPGASVTVTEQQTGAVVKVTTQHDGEFTVPNLAAANYKLVAEVVGFKRLEVDGLKVDVGSVLTQDLVMEIGGTTESVQVTGRTSLVETSSGSVGTTVTVNYVLEMPLVDRNVFNLVTMVPGSYMSAGLVSLGGGRLQTSQALVDGVNNTRGGLGANGIELSPPVESMQEFKVEVNSFGAEFGHTNGGVVNAVTQAAARTSSTAMSTSFYATISFDAKGWGNDTMPPLRRNNFGATHRRPHPQEQDLLLLQSGLPDPTRRRQHHAQRRAAGVADRRLFHSHAGRRGEGRASGDLRPQHGLGDLHESPQYHALSEQHHPLLPPRSGGSEGYDLPAAAEPRAQRSLQLHRKLAAELGQSPPRGLSHHPHRS